MGSSRHPWPEQGLIPDWTLLPELAREFYAELFARDDDPDKPKPLLLDIVHRYTLLAVGLQPPE